MLKNTYFLKKKKNNCKNRLSVGGSASESRLTSGGWGLCPQVPTYRILLQPCRVRFQR